MELNREQIVKALECCTSGNPCRECDYRRKSKDTYGCRKICMTEALSLIKKLTEENERLSKATEEAVQSFTRLETLYKIECKRVDTIKADTVRKMQSEIQKRCAEGGIYPAFIAKQIDEIAKEMVGVEE